MKGYNRAAQKDAQALAALLQDEGRVLFGDAISEDYHHDELSGTSSIPDVVVRVQTTEEVSAVMRYASQHTIPVTVRGAGTGLVGAAVVVHHGILMDMCAMDAFLELDEENLYLTVQPGVLLMDLAAYVEERGYFYPPDPGEKTATIGGNISTNAGGMRAVKYGVTRDYVNALEVVLADGEVLFLGGKVAKNSSGYDLLDLIIGAEGTLAVITKAVLRLLPLPKRIVSMLVPFPTLAGAIRTVPAITASGAGPTAVEFMEREVLLDAEEYLGKPFPDNTADAYLLLKFDGTHPEEIERAFATVADICLAAGALDVLISDTEEREESIWTARGAFLEAIKGSTTEMDEVDIVVPQSCVAELAEYTHSLAGEVGMRIKCFGHAGDGNLHAYLLRDDMPEDEWQAKLHTAMDKLYEKGRELQGKPSGEHGIGYAKRRWLAQATHPRELALMQAVKRVFDPQLILNPGKVCE
ncbi:FAD-binding protein [Ruminococcaceae bacterium OttesenSCG-928-O06]|nr:FAD-binding protein [Ruminococcaceae bacterium OttesenSCG-928-O06]